MGGFSARRLGISFRLCARAHVREPHVCVPPESASMYWDRSETYRDAPFSFSTRCSVGGFALRPELRTRRRDSTFRWLQRSFPQDVAPLFRAPLSSAPFSADYRDKSALRTCLRHFYKPRRLVQESLVVPISDPILAADELSKQLHVILRVTTCFYRATGGWFGGAVEGHKRRSTFPIIELRTCKDSFGLIY
jgi:hypothetical protein